MLTVSDLRKGAKIQLEDGQPWLVTEFDFSKPGKGQAIYNCKLKNMLTGTTMSKSFRSNDRFEKPELVQKQVRFSYENDGHYVFLNENYEELVIEEEVLGRNKYFLMDDMPVDALFFNDRVIDVELPNMVERTVISCEVGVKGNTASGKVTKPATVEGGYELAVPLFINEGDVIRIDTRTGEYNDRARTA
ncbi:MAG TPA: elongation factor P [Kiritimatiellia bacterium]|jgi:elongation factor P|nr:elongation factor P [Kiritimatiellia bacterium]